MIDLFFLGSGIIIGMVLMMVVDIFLALRSYASHLEEEEL